jgi:hypothetical protein
MSDPTSDSNMTVASIPRTAGRGSFPEAALSRRALLAGASNGFGALAFAAALARSASAGPSSPAEAGGAAASGAAGSEGILAQRHHPAKAERVIFLYMDGGVSQVDSFDHKPALRKWNGADPGSIFKVEPTQFDNVGKVLNTPWRFKQRGQSGLWVSDLFPEIAGRADDLCVIRSVVSKFSEHTSANYFLHSGSGIQGRPSVGAWFSYGLGTDNRDLPDFVVIDGGLIPVGGLDNFSAGFLPAGHQGSVMRPTGPGVANIKPLEPGPDRQRRKLRLIDRLDRLSQERFGPDAAVDAAIRNAETAFRMQTAVPELTALEPESEAMRKLYGFDHPWPQTRIYARQCLLARRLVERGVRFVELTCPRNKHDRWDQHSNLREGHDDNARAVDQPIAALLADLKARGLLETTLVVFAGEFGRTPFAQGNDGRDHNPFGFSVWMAGGGVRGGMAHGVTDDFGYKVVKDRVEMHDLHATILHLLGVDHERLTFRFGGRDMRLTDVHGRIIRPILA